MRLKPGTKCGDSIEQHRNCPLPFIIAYKPLKPHLNSRLLEFGTATCQRMARSFMFLQATGGRITMTTDSSEG